MLAPADPHLGDPSHLRLTVTHLGRSSGKAWLLLDGGGFP